MKSASAGDGNWHPIPNHKSSMTLRERWRRTMHFLPVDRIPNMEFGYWDETLQSWYEQGLPDTIRDERSAYAWFGIEAFYKAPIAVAVFPPLKEEIIERKGRYVIRRDIDGALRKEITEGARTIPQYLDFAIKDRNDWNAFKKRLDPSTPGRYPPNWPSLVEEYRRRDFPLGIRIGSMLGLPRNWIGFENIALMTYENPVLLEEIIETCCVCVCAAIERALKEVEFDFAIAWEDICFKNGPIISPKMFRQWVVPRYRRITHLLQTYGVDVVLVDCDGHITPIVDGFLEGGVNCMFPIEVAAGSDPLALREKYGHRILFHGGVDKRALSRGPEAIEREIMRLKPLIIDGGFVPHVDHRCPPDVSLENYKYYLRLKREVFGAGNLLPHYEE